MTPPSKEKCPNFKVDEFFRWLRHIWKEAWVLVENFLIDKQTTKCQAWLVMSASCQGFPPPKMTDTSTCQATWRHVGANMLATLSLVGSSDAVSMSCRHDDYPTCRQRDGVWGGVLGGH